MSHDNTLDILYFPEEMRREFAIALLEEAGATSIRVRDAQQEINHCCVLPWHPENRPSASLNWEKMVYRCLGCGSKGGILWLIGAIKGLSGTDARAWLGDQTGVGSKDLDLSGLLNFLDTLDASMASRHVERVTPKYSEAVLKPWNQICPWLTTGVPDLGIPGRGIPEDNLIEARVGWDLDTNRVVIPHFWRGDLVGWQSRRLNNDDGTPKYSSTPEFPRDRTIYGEPPRSKPVLVVESPMSRLRHMHHTSVTSTFGSVITDDQIALLKWYPKVLFWLDNDEAGWKSTYGYYDDSGVWMPGAPERLMPYTDVGIVVSDWHADPAELDDDLVDEYLAERVVPLAVWKRPEGALRCLACGQRHGGPCAPRGGD